MFNLFSYWYLFIRHILQLNNTTKNTKNNQKTDKNIKKCVSFFQHIYIFNLIIDKQLLFINIILIKSYLYKLVIIFCTFAHIDESNQFFLGVDHHWISHLKNDLTFAKFLLKNEFLLLKKLHLHCYAL